MATGGDSRKGQPLTPASPSSGTPQDCSVGEHEIDLAKGNLSLRSSIHFNIDQRLNWSLPLQKWDVGATAPALAQFFDSGFLSAEGKTAYVPGCG